jgi:hypothetical protein
MIRRSTVAIGLLLCLGIDTPAEGQMFGQRQMGRMPRRPPRKGFREIGTYTGTERFLRENRTAEDFVGADATEQAGFVGRQQSGDTPPAAMPAAAAGVQVETGPQVNLTQPRTASRTGMYRPRLRVDFRFSPRPAMEISRALAAQLERTPSIQPTSPIEVAVEGETVVLRGSVASERQRVLAGNLMLFEPGISKVQNDLTVKPLPETEAPSDPAAAP